MLASSLSHSDSLSCYSVGFHWTLSLTQLATNVFSRVGPEQEGETGMNTPRTISRMTRIITQSSLVVILAVLVGFALSPPRPDWFWFFSAIFFLWVLFF